MKNLNKILLIVFLYYSINIKAQMYVYNNVQGTQFNYLPISTNEHKFTFVTRILDYNYPVLVNSETAVIGNTLEIKMFYDITAQVVNIGNLTGYTNEVNYNQVIPSNIDYIKMSTNVIMPADNPPYNPITISNVYSRLINLSTLSTNNIAIENSKIKVYPNPTNNFINIDFGRYQEVITINLQNVLGQTISCKNLSNLDKTIVEIIEPKGLYFLEIVSYTQQKQIFKIIKE